VAKTKKIILKFDCSNAQQKRVYDSLLKLKDLKQYAALNTLADKVINFIYDSALTIIEMEEAINACEEKKERCQAALEAYIGKGVKDINIFIEQSTRLSTKSH